VKDKIKKHPFVSYCIIIFFSEYMLHTFSDYDQGGIVTIIYLTGPLWGFPLWLIRELSFSFFKTGPHIVVLFVILLVFGIVCDCILSKLKKMAR